MDRGVCSGFLAIGKIQVNCRTGSVVLNVGHLVITLNEALFGTAKKHCDEDFEWSLQLKLKTWHTAGFCIFSLVVY